MRIWKQVTELELGDLFSLNSMVFKPEYRVQGLSCYLPGKVLVECVNENGKWITNLMFSEDEHVCTWKE